MDAAVNHFEARHPYEYGSSVPTTSLALANSITSSAQYSPFAERDVMESLRNPKSAGSSFWFDAGVFDDWPPLLNLGLLQSAQRFRRLLLAGENLLSEFSKSRTNWRLG